MYAQIREANGHYGSKLPIKKDVFAKGIDPIQMANALQDQVQHIANQIAVIDHSVREVIQGQQNDRIGLYYSGLTLYLEARNVNDPEMKRALIAQSLRALSEARFQLGLTTYVPEIYNDGGVIPKERNSSFCFFVTSPMTFPT